MIRLSFSEYEVSIITNSVKVEWSLVQTELTRMENNKNISLDVVNEKKIYLNEITTLLYKLERTNG